MKSEISNTDFIKGSIEVSFPFIPYPNGYFLITKGNETRKFLPERYLEIVLKNYYDLIDKLETINEQISKWYDAELDIKRQIRELKLKEYGYDFIALFEEMQDTKTLLEKRRELGSIANEKAQVTSTQQPERETFGFRLDSSNETNDGSKDALSILKFGKLISNSTFLPQLKDILYNQKKIKKSIQWIGSVPALHEFIVALWKPHGNKKGKWQTGSNCFLFNGTKLTASKLQNNKGASQKDKATIKKAIAALKITT